MLILLALLIVESSSLEEECTLHRLQGCSDSLKSLQENDLALAATREELMTVCKSLKTLEVCVDEHTRHCFTTTQRKVFNHVVSGAREFLKELCVPGKTQDTYLRHSPCYRNVTLSEDKCAPEYRLLTELSEQVDKESDIDLGLKRSCCAFNAFIQCKHTHARRDCGREAAHFLQQHLDRISNPLIHDHCEHYMHARNACNGLSSASSSYVYQSSVLLLNIFFSIFVSVINKIKKDL